MAEEQVNQLAEVDGGPLMTGQESIFAQIEKGLVKNPNAPAVICMHQPPDHLSGWAGRDALPSEVPGSQFDCLTLTYAQLYNHALKLVSGLLACDAQPGQVILCMIENGVEYALLLWACAILRLTLSAVDPAVLDQRDIGSLKDYLQLLKPDLIVVRTSSDSKVVGSAYSEFAHIRQPTIRLFIQAKNNVSSPPGWSSLHDTAHLPNTSFSETTILQQARLDNPARVHSILFTSGTSAGCPKGCPLTVASMTHILASQSWLITGQTASRVLQQAHNSRAIGPQHTLQTWRTGGAIVLPTGPSFAVEQTLEAIARHHVTFIVVSPAMVHAIANALPSLPTGARDAVRTIQVGGDVVTREVLVKCAALFPCAKVCVNHGMSEGGGFFICPAGRVARGARVKIWDARARKVAVASQLGELHVSCGSLIHGYMDGMDKTAFYVDEKGVRWMNTGDIAIMTDDQLVYILGRSKDAISSPGTIIMPAAMESCIEKYTGRQTCVVAIPKPPLGQEPFAVVSDLDGFAVDQVINHVRETLGERHGITGVASLKEIGLDRFPVNATHKIVKSEVQKAVFEYMGGNLIAGSN
ncbi:hypothetical protein B0I35DRAFT_446937 [Stachybotrys elegans]|uniref:AMP-dependent synthetase/ligase domain-containing protein n=1 Tax=Stachybotrys elegans TaxID=80388 RepID=A0A8K0SD74_9HYPO|nr:hypothetical protein B0I35DRAFT_446937 [Stachybotrys elegans]